MIITGGENVYPMEVEEVLFTREEVQECAVIRVADREWGERVLLHHPASGKNFNKEELTPTSSRAFRLSSSKEYRLVNDFPKARG